MIYGYLLEEEVNVKWVVSGRSKGENEPINILVVDANER
jgi:hypothetical protein